MLSECRHSHSLIQICLFLYLSSVFISGKSADDVWFLHWICDVIESRRAYVSWSWWWPWLTEALSEREKRTRVNRDTMECRERRENGFLIGLGVLELSSLYAQREYIINLWLIAFSSTIVRRDLESPVKTQRPNIELQQTLECCKPLPGVSTACWHQPLWSLNCSGMYYF